jgi:tetratricopeptide (TPR) repeat protein
MVCCNSAGLLRLGVPFVQSLGDYTMRRKKRAFLWLFAIVLLASSCAGLRHFRAGDSFERGLALFNKGQFEDAIPYFQRATDEDPKFAEAYLYLGRSHLSARHWREAIQPLRTAYRLAPEGAKDEVFNVLLDALLGAGLPPERPERFRDTL